MKITFYGLLAKHKKKLIKDLIEFSLKKFINDMSKLKIEIEIRNSSLIAGNLALLHIDNENESLFIIEIGNRQNFGKMMLSIAHECVHIKQYYLGEILDISDERIIFLEKEYDTDAINYWDQPWEIEAHGREHGLLLRFVEANNLQKEEWLKIFH